MSKKILVTGGAGYIGSHTVVELSKNGYEVIIIDNFSNSNPIILNKLYKLCEMEGGKKPIFYDRDCRNSLTYFFDDILDIHKVDGIIHFAAHKSVGDSIKNPLEYYDNNINSLITVLDACRRYNITNFVFSSSCSLYGDVENLPVNEKTPISDPQSPYAYTKLVGERMVQDFCKVNEVNGISLRYFNPVGAHESGMIGESPISKPNNIIPVICDAVDGNELTVFGNDYNTRDGSCIRDYVHVSDIANAHVLSLEWMMNHHMRHSIPYGYYDVFNLGSESGVSVFELINTFERVNGVKVKYKLGIRRPGDVVQIYSDSTKAKQTLGWTPKYNIEDMVSSSWKWYKNNLINE
jgi:UDP-glucose 4-epimerase